MANVPVNISRTIVQRPNGSASNAPVFDFPVDPLNPPGGGGAGSQIPPVHLAYSSEANMIAGQANQIANFIYFDGTKYWEYLGTTNGTIVDYRAWSGGDIVQPNGLTQIGTFVQTGNDIDVNPDWIWRFNQVLYQKTTITPFTIAPAAVGFTRIDLIYGNTSTQVLLVSGTEVEDPTPAVPPSVPANSVGFFLVFVDDSGITAFQEFALSSFVRFDVNNQNLSAVQRQNARTNIQALSRDTADTATGDTYFFRNSISSKANFAIRNTTPSGFGFSGTAQVIVLGDVDTGKKVFELANGSFVQLFSMLSSGASRFELASPLIPQSANSDQAVRRDELPYNFPQTYTASGILNNLSGIVDAQTKLLILTQATELTGIVPVPTNKGRLLRIENRNATGLIIRHDSASSTEANRFSLPSATDLTINQNEIYTFIYTNSRWRRVL
jgi:hypothetical protein